MIAAAAPAAAQTSRAPAPAPAPAQRAPAQAAPTQPGVDEGLALRLLWSTIIAIDQANRTGEYAVLRDMGSANFQATNNPATLATAFAPLRNQQIDLTTTLLVAPTWRMRPTLVAPGQLRMQGIFPLRPVSIAFDLMFVWDRGWRLQGAAVQGVPATTVTNAGR